MLRAILSILLLVLSPVMAFAATCQEYEVQTFIADSPYLLNRMSVVEGDWAGGVRLVHDDDPGISAIFSLAAVESRPVVRRSEFLRSIESELAVRSEDLKAEGRVDVEAGVFPYDPMAWSISSVDSSGQQRNGDTRIALSRECDLVVLWSTSTSPVLSSRVVEFRAALDAVRAFAGRHIDAPQFLKENTSPAGYSALITGFAAPLLASLALAYGLSSLRLLPRPGVATRLMALSAALVAGTSIVLHLAIVEGELQFFLLSLVALLGVTVVVSLASAIVPQQVLALLGFSLVIVVGLTFASATYLDWLPRTELGYATAACLMAFGGLGLWSWQHLEAIKVRRRTTKSA